MMCPECQVNLPSDARRCPLCGWTGPAQAPPQAAPQKPVAWEEPHRGRIGRWWATAQESIFHPGRFYQALPAAGSLSAAYHYAYFNKFLVLAPILTILFLVVCGAGAVVTIAAPDTSIPVGAILALSAVGIVALPALVYVFGWPCAFVGALILHVSGKIFGAKGTFRGTFRMLSYAGATDVVTAVASLVGLGIIGTVWHYVLLFFGYRHVHGMSSGRAIAAILLPVIVLVVIPLTLLVGTYVGVAVSCAAAHNVPDAVKRDVAATADEFGAAWAAGDREAMAAFLVDQPGRPVDRQLDELLTRQPESLEVNKDVRRRLFFDPKVRVPGVGRGRTYVVSATATRGDDTQRVNLAVVRQGDRWVVAKVWKAGCGGGRPRCEVKIDTPAAETAPSAPAAPATPTPPAAPDPDEPF